MSAVVACGPSSAVAVSRLRTVLFALLCLASAAAFAVEDDSAPQGSSATAPSGELAWRPQLEVSASSLPRFDSADGTTRSDRLDMTWLPPRRSALGLSLGMAGLPGMVPPAPAGFAPRPGTAPTVDLGLRWRYTLDGNYRVDVTAWRRMVPPDALTLVQTHEPSYGARVEMQLGKSQKSGLVAERGFLGFQLESGARVTLRRSGGRPMVYYRSKF